MPHKRNPVASIAVLGCTRQVPGLLATLAAAAEQEHQRAAGAWHAEWEPLADLLRLTGSAASWAADLLSGLEPDPGRMRRNLGAAGGFPMAEHAAALLTPALGRTAAHDLLAGASAAAVAEGRPLGDALLDRLDAGRLGGERDHAGAGHRRPGPGRVPGRGRRVRGRGPDGARPGRLLALPLAGAGWAQAGAARTAPVLPDAPGVGNLPGPAAASLPEPLKGGTMDDAERAAQGMTVRREVLGDEHVDRAVAATTPLTAPFQDFITRYAWGEIWSRPGLSRAERSMITLTALVVLRQEEELAMHLRAALRNGLTPDQISEVLLHTAVYAGVPAANRAFAIARQVLAETG